MFTVEEVEKVEEVEAAANDMEHNLRSH